MFRFFMRLVSFSLLAPVTTLADTYTVPIYGFAQGASGSYSSGLFITNPNPTEVTVTVTEMYALQSVPCLDCSSIQVKIDPFGFRPFTEIPRAGNQQLQLGAFTLESTQPIQIEAWVFTNPPPGPRSCPIDYRQQIPIIRNFAPGGSKTWIPAALALGGQGTNLFIINPNSFAIRVGYSVGTDVPEQDSVLVPPKASTVRRVTLPQDAPTFNRPINLFSSDTFYAVSSNGVIIQPAITAGMVLRP
jgi:hypothetical protein